MSHQKIIQDLIAWMTNILTSRLTLMSSQKNQAIQVVLATDVPHGDASDAWRLHRQRRLLLAAVELRTTERPILISQWTWVMSRSRPSPAFSVAV